MQYAAWFRSEIYGPFGNLLTVPEAQQGTCRDSFLIFAGHLPFFEMAWVAAGVYLPCHSRCLLACACDALLGKQSA